MSELNREMIASMIPHGSSMSLIDQVDHWDADQISCITHSHLRDDNPLREGNTKGLDSIISIEYAAQAAAIHAALLNTGLGANRPAYVGAVKSVVLHQSRLDDNNEMVINATAEMTGASGAIYSFGISSQNKPLAEGTLILIQP